jgi:hypothetical protein
MKTTEGINSCLMLAVRLDLPVDLGSIFDSEDITDLELDSHVTVLYAKNKTIEPQELKESINMILDKDQIEALTNGDNELDLLELTELGLFENDDDYLVLKLKDSWQKKFCTILNKGLSTKFDVVSDFSSYNPHITLATLKKGTGKKYLDSEKVRLVLEKGILAFEDLMVSYGGENDGPDRKQFFLTNRFCVSRYFRIDNLRKSNNEL